MGLTVISPNTNLVVSLDSFKAHSRIDGNDGDTIITSYLLAAQEYCQGKRGEYFLSTQLKLWAANPATANCYQRAVLGLADDADKYLDLPGGAIISIDSVEYYDSENTLQTMNTTAYRVNGTRVAFTDSFPTLYKREDAIQITYTVGYIDEYSAPNVPERLQQAIRLLAATWYTRRENEVSGTISQVPITVDRLLRV